jgi:hypothetical protein
MDYKVVYKSNIIDIAGNQNIIDIQNRWCSDISFFCDTFFLKKYHSSSSFVSIKADVSPNTHIG